MRLVHKERTGWKPVAGGWKRRLAREHDDDGRAILMEKHAACPQCFHLKDSSPTDWMAVTHNLSPHELEKELSAAGWIFFHMAIAIRTTAFGFNRAKMIHAALKRLVANVRRQGCNALKSTTWRPAGSWACRM